jgi:hypothetical protein
MPDCGARPEPGSLDDQDWDMAHDGGWLCLECMIGRIKASDL